MKFIAMLLTVALVFGITACNKRTTEVFYDTVATPTFNPKPYMYGEPQLVNIYCATPTAIIRYTTSGYFTYASSKVYTKPILVDRNMTIKAVAFKDGMQYSGLATGEYVFYGGGYYHYIHNITAEPDTIFADNGLSISTVSVKIRDYENIGIPNQLVLLRSNLGHINSTAVTDSTGIARAVFTADNVTGIATIWAVYKSYHPDYPEFLVSADTASIYVAIAGIPPINSFTLQLPTLQDPFPTTVMQSINVSATARNILDYYVVDGTLISFSSTLGYFIDSQGISLGSSIEVPTVNGTASTIFNAGSVTGTAILTAQIDNFTADRNVLISP